MEKIATCLPSPSPFPLPRDAGERVLEDKLAWMSLRRRALPFGGDTLVQARQMARHVDDALLDELLVVLDDDVGIVAVVHLHAEGGVPALRRAIGEGISKQGMMQKVNNFALPVLNPHSV